MLLLLVPQEEEQEDQGEGRQEREEEEEERRCWVTRSHGQTSKKCIFCTSRVEFRKCSLQFLKGP